jgi:toxin YoeB
MPSPKKPEPYKLSVDPNFLEDLQWWVAKLPRIATKISKLVVEVQRTPYQGTGQPERTKHLDPNTWSRRITQEHRLVYRVDGAWIYLLQCRYHYE